MGGEPWHLHPSPQTSTIAQVVHPLAHVPTMARVGSGPTYSQAKLFSVQGYGRNPKVSNAMLPTAMVEKRKMVQPNFIFEILKGRK
jgi:hypothetical protein